MKQQRAPLFGWLKGEQKAAATELLGPSGSVGGSAASPKSNTDQALEARSEGDMSQLATEGPDITDSPWV